MDMFSFAIALATASVAEQMAPAKQGFLQCQMPDTSSKTCFSLSAVRQTGPSTYSFKSDILIDAAGPVIASMQSIVFVRGVEICQVMKLGELAGASITFDGHPLSGAEAQVYRARLRADFAPVAGHQICTRILPGEQGALTVIGTLDGRRIPAGDYQMKWVTADDGWKVAP
jgi:hypothetical protein